VEKNQNGVIFEVHNVMLTDTLFELRGYVVAFDMKR
jgi:hypothetical protein